MTSTWPQHGPHITQICANMTPTWRQNTMGQRAPWSSQTQWTKEPKMDRQQAPHRSIVIMESLSSGSFKHLLHMLHMTTESLYPQIGFVPPFRGSKPFVSATTRTKPRPSKHTLLHYSAAAVAGPKWSRLPLLYWGPAHQQPVHFHLAAVSNPAATWQKKTCRGGSKKCVRPQLGKKPCTKSRLTANIPCRRLSGCAAARLHRCSTACTLTCCKRSGPKPPSLRADCCMQVPPTYVHAG